MVNWRLLIGVKLSSQRGVMGPPDPTEVVSVVTGCAWGVAPVPLPGTWLEEAIWAV